MTQFNTEPHLHGWDDEKVYFIDEHGKEHCINDYPDLFVQLQAMCQNYFALHIANQSDDAEV